MLSSYEIFVEADYSSRLLVVNLVSLAWNCVLSSINAGDGLAEKQMKTIQVD